jgi:hypothetical protein
MIKMENGCSFSFKMASQSKYEMEKRFSIPLADHNTFKEITVQKCWNM